MFHLHFMFFNTFFFNWQILKQESGAFHLRITRDSVSNTIYSVISVFVSVTFAILSDRTVFHTQWISSVG